MPKKQQYLNKMKKEIKREEDNLNQGVSNSLWKIISLPELTAYYFPLSFHNYLNALNNL